MLSSLHPTPILFLIIVGIGITCIKKNPGYATEFLAANYMCFYHQVHPQPTAVSVRQINNTCRFKSLWLTVGELSVFFWILSSSVLVSEAVHHHMKLRILLGLQVPPKSSGKEDEGLRREWHGFEVLAIQSCVCSSLQVEKPRHVVNTCRNAKDYMYCFSSSPSILFPISSC